MSAASDSAARRVFVLKLGGEVVKGALEPLTEGIRELVAQGHRVVVVHGGGPQATELSKQLGLVPNLVGGRRITDEATLDVMKMVVAGKVNVDLCAALLRAGARPVGLHGASHHVIQAVKRPPKVIAGAGPDPIDFGHVGDVTQVDTTFLLELADRGLVPVLACLGASADGSIFNINADTVANQVAMALRADSLLLITDVPAVLRDVSDPGSRIARLSVAEGKALIQEGVVTRGMIPKLEESFAAIASGVRSITILGKLGEGQLSRAATEPGSVGTVISP